MKDTRTPVWVSFWTLVVNLVAGLVLMQYFAHVGLAIALTLASLFNAVVLTLLLSRRIGGLSFHFLVGSLLRILPGLLLMGVTTKIILSFGAWQDASIKLQNGFVLAAAVLAGSVVYLITCRLFGVSILSELRGLLKRKKSA